MPRRAIQHTQHQQIETRITPRLSHRMAGGRSASVLDTAVGVCLAIGIWGVILIESLRLVLT